MDKKTINIVELIPVGHENAITRQELCRITGLRDRDVRNLIEDARAEHCICNNCDGAGYYIPTELSEINDFIAQETSRAKSIFRSLRGAKTLKNLMERGVKNEY